jgi:hypothetical protein
VWGTKWCTMIYLMDPKNLRYNPKQSKIEGWSKGVSEQQRKS